MTYGLHALRGDFFGGLTAAVVALPLALAFGVASGLGAIEGLYGAVAVGFLAAVFGGTKTVISGPTGPMAVAMAVIIANHAGNDIGHALTIVVLAGVIQILLGLVRIGRLVSYTPYSVISGFMSGIGVIIMVIHDAALRWPARHRGRTSGDHPPVASGGGGGQLERIDGGGRHAGGGPRVAAPAP